MTLADLKALDQAHFMNVFGPRLPVCFTRGQGATLYDQEGNAYTDLFAGIAVNALGYNHPAVTGALCAQAQTGVLHTSNLYYVAPQAELAQLLCENTFADKAFFANSGAEANEGAMKLAVKYFYERGEDRCEILSACNSFHGRTLATVAATGQEKYQKPYRPLLPAGVRQVPFMDLDALRTALTPRTAAILLEPIQGEGGVIEATPEYLQAVRALCDQTGTLLIFDEIQTGMCRTGTLYAYEQFGVIPDILTSAKALGCGVPIGAILASERVASAFHPGDHGSTFGGNTLCCAVALSVMRTMLADRLAARAAQLGAYLKDALRAIDSDKILEVRGRGLILGVALREGAAAGDVMRALLQKGFVAGTAAGNTLRIEPPLIIEKQALDAFCAALADILAA